MYLTIARKNQILRSRYSLNLHTTIRSFSALHVSCLMSFLRSEVFEVNHHFQGYTFCCPEFCERQVNRHQNDDEFVQFCVTSKIKNVSITNFARILVEKLFTEAERYNRNWRGNGPRNKEILKLKKLKLIKAMGFLNFSVPVAVHTCTWTNLLERQRKNCIGQQ